MGSDRAHGREEPGRPAPSERLPDLPRLQQELVTGGRWPEAVAAGEAWQRLVDTLPAQAPPEAQAVLEEAEATAGADTAAIEAVASTVSHDLEHVHRGRRALAPYATAGQA